MAVDDKGGAASTGPADPRQEVLELEAAPPSAEDEESWIEPAEPPGAPAAAETHEAHEAAQSGAAAAREEPPRPPVEAAQQQIELGLPSAAEADEPGGVRLVIAFASGKGGVGKSLLAASVGVYLAQLGKEVVLVDAAIGAGTLHTLVGSSGPGPSLQQFINREIKELADTIIPTPFPGLGLISGLNDGIGAANPRPAQKNRLLSQLRTLPTDYVILDLAPGTGFNVLDMFLAADLQVVVAAPEPTSIECAFRLIKSAFLRQVRGVSGIEVLLAATAAAAHFGLPTPQQIHRAAAEQPELQRAVHDVMRCFKPRLLVNQCRAREDLEVGPQLALLGRRHLGLPIDYVGYVDHDDAVWVALRRRRPLQVEFPEAKVCKDIDRVTRRLLALENKEEPTCVELPAATDELTHYELFGIHPGATGEEIRRAHRWLRRIYDDQSNVAYGLAPPAEVAEAHRRIDEAYATLVDGDKRHRYDQHLFPETSGAPDAPDVPPLQPARAAVEQRLLAHAAQLDAPPVAMPAIDDATEFTGALLRQVREARGVELREMAEKTKITMAHLRAIEEEDFHYVLAPVYLRGFVKAVAQHLRLDPDRVAQSYMQRYEAAHGAE